MHYQPAVRVFTGAPTHHTAMVPTHSEAPNEKTASAFICSLIRVDASERILFKENREVPLTPKVFDTLLVLLENSSHVLTKKELMQQVWPDSFVEENNLAQNISILRKALGAGKEGEHYIQTVPKRGYRFVADVRSTGDEESLIVRERTRARIVVEQSEEEDALRSLVAAPSRVIDVAAVASAEIKIPETMYARSGDVNIAYQVVGDAR